MSIGKRLRDLRKKRPGLKQYQVAEEIGISRQALSGIETGGDLPGRDTLVALASYYGVSVDYLQAGDAALPPEGCEIVEDPDELALLRFWRSLEWEDKQLATRLLQGIRATSSVA